MLPPKVLKKWLGNTMDINNLLKLAAEKNASDIHLLFGYVPILRIDGELHDINEIVTDGNFSRLSSIDLEGFIDTMLTKEQKSRFFDKRDLDLGYQVGEYRYRVNFAFEKNNITIVARIISEKNQTLQDVGMPTVVEELLNLPQGFILVTGPTGCGKSTT
jgi:twitching motility protein PilT